MEQGLVFVPFPDKDRDSYREHAVKILIVIMTAVFLTGCAHLDPNHASTMDGCANRIGKRISSGLENSYMGVSILVSTPVDAVTFAPSDFGLALQELIISALAGRNENVLEVQLRKEPYINCEEGLVSLSRDASRLRPDFKADVIVVSTYLALKEDVIVTTRAIDFTTNDVITSATATLERNEQINSLLRNRQQVKLYEK
jgi:hypothetical protein